ncbi:MAG: DUF190 domain-containing protein [Curvibacter lanceolatus]|uniref:DUF190 domain-containing protein n=1 Tax=Curvibacter lanceolatus TaxID=86182 RepID=UPI0003A59DFD|nr:DUF190 domain-containing protein [Curvibacter lanceolatus]MBV5295458.1 DUF190 domain-containing protein [Curvibacter lanceolatus]
MHGYQLTFYTQQDRTQGHEPLAQWLLAQAQSLGIRGATLSGSLEGLDHQGRIHAINMFDVGDQPVQLTLIVSEVEDRRLFNHLKASGVQVFYTRSPVEFGTLGPSASADNPQEPSA